MRVFGAVKQGVAEGYSEKGVLGLVLIGTQLFTALTPFIPLIKLALQTVTKCLKSSVPSSILFKMRTFKNRNCRLRFMAFSTADVIIDLLQEKPGGSSFWRRLPLKGRDNREVVRKKIADTLLHAFYDDNFISILLKGALDDKGKPRGDGTLYRWLLTHVYSDNAQKLYGDWLKAGKYQEGGV
jgi:hypothetical protein